MKTKRFFESLLKEHIIWECYNKKFQKVPTNILLNIHNHC